MLDTRLLLKGLVALIVLGLVGYFALELASIVYESFIGIW